jgi:LacI family transcriptional regulator
VREAVDELAAQGVPVVTLISDLAQSRRAACVGLDNRAAGRTAATLIGRFLGPRRGPVAMIAGSLSYRGHEEREMGFMRLIEEQFPHLQVVGVREGRDDAETNYRQTRTLLRQHPDLVGLYNIGGGAEGVGRALQERRGSERAVFVAHGLTPDTRALLIDGTLDAVINQHPQTMILNTVRIFTNLRDGRSATAGVEPVRISIVLRENLP